MDKTEQDILYIEQYLENKLTGEQKAEFEERLRKDKDFSRLMQQTKNLIAGIEYSGRNKLMQELKDLEASMPEITTGKEAEVHPIRGRKYFPWAVAACISLLLVVSVFLVNYNMNSGTMALYNAHYEPYPNIVYPIKRGDLAHVGDREFAYQAYDLEDYKRAITLFEGIPDAERKAEDLLYLGNAYLAAGEAGKATETLEKLLESFHNFTAQGKWYLSLSYLRQGETGACKDLLREIIADETSYSPNARELLKDLE